MPAFTTAESFGIINAKELQEKFPALSISTGTAVAREAGIEPTPKNIAMVMKSRSFQEKMSSLAESKDNRALERIYRGTPFTPGFQAGTPEEQTERAFGEKAATFERIGRGRQILGGRLLTAEVELAQMGDINRESIKRQRLSEMQPTKDIDQRIFELRNQMLASESILREQLKDLPFSMQQAAMSARNKIFIDSIRSLSDMREARIKSAEGIIDEEIQTKEDRVNAVKARISALEKAEDFLKEAGEDQNALAQLRLDRIKAMKDLAKARGKGAGGTEEDMMLQLLIDRYIKQNGVSPTGPELNVLKMQAKRASEQVKERTARLPAGPSSIRAPLQAGIVPEAIEAQPSFAPRGSLLSSFLGISALPQTGGE